MSHVDVNTLVSEDAAVAQVEVYLDGHTFTTKSVGSAKKHPTDPAVHAVGEALALSRALREVSDKLETYALDTNAEHIRQRDADKSMRRLLEVLGIED